MLRNRVEGEGNENAPGDVIASTLANHLLGNPNTLINTLSVFPFCAVEVVLLEGKHTRICSSQSIPKRCKG